MLMIVVIAVLVLLYGLAWHNQPAKEREVSSRRADILVRSNSETHRRDRIY